MKTNNYNDRCCDRSNTDSQRIMTARRIRQFTHDLAEDEKSPATIHKYISDLNKLHEFADDRPLTKELMLAYKEHLISNHYELSSINSYLTAANSFLSFMGWNDARVHTCKIQHLSFYPDEKCLTREEFRILVQRARTNGNIRLVMILNTICSTGIRISELKFITVESLEKGKAVISCKGKTRVVLMSENLVESLKKYVRDQGISKGIIFRTLTGKPVDRSNIWRQMKALCAETGINEEKVFPHNLRHLFARTFYEEGKDIAKLADVLGHSSIETTRIYIMTTGEEHRKYLEQMKLLY